MDEPKEFTRYLKKVTDEDIARLEEVLQENPGDMDVLDWLAFATYSAGRYDRAVQLYERCIAQEPETVSFHYFLGNCYWHVQQHAKARNEWNRVIEMDAEGKFRSRAADKLKLVEK
ncbi:MAG: tetratricopeptide repeat protein [Candidatus Wallbacteria bacterium]|nr:tetratricopeptide repeat protein [Candidatus Wallbacteria bacterium]